MSYYNTTGMSGQQLKQATKQSKTQDDVILDLLTKNRHNNWGASTISRCVNYPLTSIRRSLNTLENDKKIKKTGFQKIGAYGRPENLYVVI